MTLKVRFSGFVTITRSVTVAHPVDRQDELIDVLEPLLDQLDPSPGIRLLGVSGSNLGAPSAQLTFEDLDDDTPDWEAATDALDEIRERFGDNAIGPASSLSAGRLRTVRRGAQQWGPDRPDSSD